MDRPAQKTNKYFVKLSAFTTDGFFLKGNRASGTKCVVKRNKKLNIHNEDSFVLIMDMYAYIYSRHELTCIDKFFDPAG